jgi:hypothetical protein
MSVYLGILSDKESLEGSFDLSSGSLEDCNILFASYDVDGYEGSALVLYEQGGKLYEVHGSHCSCYGLEGQWDPEECSVEVIKHYMDKGDWSYYLNGNESVVLEAIAQLDNK